MLKFDIGPKARHGHFSVYPMDDVAWAVKETLNGLASCRYIKRVGEPRHYEIAFPDYALLMQALRARGSDHLVRGTVAFNEYLERYNKWVRFLMKLRARETTDFTVDGIHGDLRMHQRTGAEFMILRRYAICADEMGVGKSLEAAAAAWYLIQQGKARRVLIVCPASVKTQWAKDTLERFLPQATYTIVGSDFGIKHEVKCPHAGQNITAKSGRKTVTRRVPKGHLFEPRKAPCRGCVYGEGCKVQRGDGRSNAEIRAELYSRPTDFTIVNYELVRIDNLGKVRKNSRGFKIGGRHPSLIEQAGAKWDVIIADEAHRLRNARTDTFEAMWKLAADAHARWGLTGTPLQTRLEDAWGIMRFVNPAVFGTQRFRFVERYAEKDYWGAIIRYVRVEEAHHKLLPNMIRRRKVDVLKDLPPIIEAQRYVALSGKETKLYQAIKNQQVIDTMVADEETRDHLNTCEPIVTSIRCRQVALSGNILTDGISFEHSAKVKEIRAILDEVAGDHKSIIFSESEQFLLRLSKALEGWKIGHVLLRGKVAAGKARQALQDRFQEDDDCRCFLTTTAGGEGLNLQVADIVILCNLCWNPKLVEQVKARAHRMGQQNPVSVITLLAQNTIEEKVFADARYRNSIANQAVDGKDTSGQPPIPLAELMGML